MLQFLTSEKSAPKEDPGRAEDVALMKAAGQGDPEARRKVVAKLLNRIRSTSYYLASGHPDAEDYAQMAVMEILGSAASFRGDSPLVSWAEKITVRTVMRQIRRRRWRGQYLSYDSEADSTVFSSAEEDVARQRVLRHVAKLFSDLKPQVRAVLTLKLVYGHSIAEIADIIETNEHNVRYRLRVGRQRLRTRIKNDPVLKEWVRNCE